MIGGGVWGQLFLITNNIYEQLALEVLATLQLSRGTIKFHRAYTIQLQVFGILPKMSLTKFSIWLGHYDAELTRTPAYDALLISWPSGKSFKDAWHTLSTDSTYGPHQSQATYL